MITEITVTPSEVKLAKGQLEPLMASAIYSDGSSSDVTSTATWKSNDDNTATVTAIELTPKVNELFVKGQPQQLTAMATLTDGSKADITGSVTWDISHNNTAGVTHEGVLTGSATGATNLKSIKGGIVSNTVDISVCSLADACINLFDVGGGKLITNGPSVAYSRSVGGLPHTTTYNLNTAATVAGSNGVYLRFNWGDAENLCVAYNNLRLGGRTNWRMPTECELLGMRHFGDIPSDPRNRNDFPSMVYHGWPAPHHFYWSSTSSSSARYNSILQFLDHEKKKA